MDKTLKRIYITIYIAGVVTCIAGFIMKKNPVYVFGAILQTVAFVYFMIMWSEKK